MSGTAMNEGPIAGGLPRGLTPPSGRGGRLLGDVLVELGFAEREAVEQALEASRAPGKRLGSTLVEMGILTEHELGRGIAERYRLDYLDLEEFEVDPEAAQLIGDKEVKRYEAVPVAFTEDGALVVAMVDPADWLAADEIAQLTGRRVRRAVASPEGVAHVIARFAKSGAGEEQYAGEGFEDDVQVPARLALRRVDNPLTSRPGASDESPPEEDPSVVAPSEEESAVSADEPPVPGTELDQAGRDLVFARTELEGMRAERARLDTELRATRGELAETRSELAAVRAWTDAALKRAVDAEHGLGDARSDVSRLEAELVAARDQAESLRGDLSWARRQIERLLETASPRAGRTPEAAPATPQGDALGADTTA